MATTLQLRRGTAAEAAAFTGAVGELFIDVQNKLVYLHDGVTAGGVLVGGTGSGSGTAVVSGAVSGNTLTLTNSDASTVNINVATLAQDTDTNTYVTSATIAGSVITLHNNNGSTVDINLPSSVTGFLPGEVTEDMLPQFDAVYDLGSDTKRWYDIKASNSVSIGNAVLKEVDGVLTVNAEVVANNLVGTDIVVDEALIGTNLHVGSTITPEGISTEYVDTKGTLTIDGNLSVLDDLNVRNKITLKQTPLNVGSVIGTSTVEAIITPMTIDGATAQQMGFFRVYFTNENNYSTFYFYNASDAAAFAANITVGAQLNVNVVASGNPYACTLLVAQVSYNQSWTTVDISFTTQSGTPPWNISSYNNWYWSWYDSMQSYQMANIAYDKIIPAKYNVKFDGLVPSLASVSKLMINGTSTIVQDKTFDTLYQFADYVAPGSSMGMNNFAFQQTNTGPGMTMSVMMSNTVFFNYLASGTQMVFRSTMSGLSWTLKILGLGSDMMYGTYLKYEVLSASDSQYPDPSNYSGSFSAGTAGFTITVSTDIKSYLTSVNVGIAAIDTYSSATDIRAYFNVGDALSYTTPSTSIVFGDSTTGTKAITYDETTGKITYDGLVSALNIDTTRHALYSADSLIVTNSTTPADYSVTIGNAAIVGSSAEAGVAVGSNASVSSYHGVAVGYNARSDGNGTVCVGGGNARGNFSTYVGTGGDGIGNMYHSTVLGMMGDSSSGWMWGGGQHVMTLGTAYLWVRNAGDYSTLINGGGTGTSAADYNMIGGSTWLAPQDRHGELLLSVYQYAYISSAGTVYPQLGYGASSGAPYNFTTAASTSNETTINVNKAGINGYNGLAQGKITVTVMRRNSDDYGIYEIAFVARRNQSGVSSIVQQTTTVIAQANAATYWGNPQMHLNGDSLQLSMTTTASAVNSYITVHVGGPVRTSSAY